MWIMASPVTKLKSKVLIPWTYHLYPCLRHICMCMWVCAYLCLLAVHTPALNKLDSFVSWLTLVSLLSIGPQSTFQPQNLFTDFSLYLETISPRYPNDSLPHLLQFFVETLPFQQGLPYHLKLQPSLSVPQIYSCFDPCYIPRAYNRAST